MSHLREMNNSVLNVLVQKFEQLAQRYFLLMFFV